MYYNNNTYNNDYDNDNDNNDNNNTQAVVLGPPLLRQLRELLQGGRYDNIYIYIYIYVLYIYIYVTIMWISEGLTQAERDFKGWNSHAYIYIYIYIYIHIHIHIHIRIYIYIYITPGGANVII